MRVGRPRKGPDDSDAGVKEEESKRMPRLCNGGGYGPCVRRESEPHFSLVFHHERTMINRHEDAKQMTTERSVGAASYISVHWREIDWRSVNESVRRLQVRIVKAVETGKWGKVKALQRLLTSSRNGKLLAIRRVTENAGRNTSGVDGVRLEHARRRRWQR